ncbi:protein translocase subunit SecD [Candidatus Peregrinibacteria bacterium]|nr:MAG: protein translocase subunit SecD [Candidatus Peregrinibacteria bacterium]
MMKHWKVISLILFFIYASMMSLPTSWQGSLPQGLQNFIQSHHIVLGLDLQGGTQLTYSLDLSKAEKFNADDDPENDINIATIVEGVRTTLEYRVNQLGVSEPNIYIAQANGEYQVIVELAGIKDINEAKAIVGKTIQLEFKEAKENLEESQEEDIAYMKSRAEKALIEMETRSFDEIGKKAQTSDGKIVYEELSRFKDEIPESYREKVWNAEILKVMPEILEINDGFTFNALMQGFEQKGFALFHPLSKIMEERTVTTPGKDFEELAQGMQENYKDENVSLDYFPPEARDVISSLGANKISDVIELSEKYILFKMLSKEGRAEQVQASHILISHNEADLDIETRTKEAASILANKVLLEIQEGGDWDTITQRYSDDKATKNQAGDLGLFEFSKMHKPFAESVFALQDEEISGVVETESGFHIIKKIASFSDNRTFTTAKIVVNKSEENAKQKIDNYAVEILEKVETKQEEKITYERIYFSIVPDMWKETELDGSTFQFASLGFTQLSEPVVNIRFTDEGARLFEELTERNLQKAVAIFVGGELKSAPRVGVVISTGQAQITGMDSIQEAAALVRDLNTGAIDAPIILIGQNQIDSTLGAEALEKSLYAGIFGLMLLFIYMLFQYRLFGVVANIALLYYAVLLFFVLKFFGFIGVPIVLTLAGIAGIVLSIGMAVDANILIFERIKEELKEGKSVKVSLAVGFERAWSSIRDSNISSLITCFILAWFGSSIIRGFAINLAIGIIISMFTAVVVTRILLRVFFARSDSVSKWTV